MQTPQVDEASVEKINDAIRQIVSRTSETLQNEITSIRRDFSKSNQIKPDVSWQSLSDALLGVRGNVSGLAATLNAIVSDGVVSSAEKPAFVREMTTAMAGRAGLVEDATALNVIAERDAYTAAWDALLNYLESLTPAWDDNSVSTPIVADTLLGLISTLASAKEALMSNITKAQQAILNDIVLRMSYYESDDWITEAEKNVYRMTWEQIEQRHPGLMFDGARLGPNTVVTPWSDAYDALYAIRNVWIETGQTDISSVNPKPSARFNTYFAAEQALEDALDDGIRVGIDSALTPSVVADGVTTQFLHTGPTVTCEDWRGVWTLSSAPRTNLVTYSNTFTAGTWYRSNYPTVTTGIVSPTGATNASKLTAGSTAPYLQQTTPSLSLGSYTGSIWIKGIGASIGKAGMLWFWEAGTGRAATPNTKTIFTIPAEWTRISVTANVTTAGTFILRLDAPDHVATIGDEVCIFNMQLEAGAAATPDIITPGNASVTVTDITTSNGLATLSPAPLQGAILRGVSSNAASVAAGAAAIIAAASLDTKITNLERPALRNLRASLAASVTSAKAKADAMVPAVAHSALDTAWTTFTTNVDPILAATTDTTIVKATFDGWWSAVYSAITDLQGAMTRQAEVTANSAYAATIAAGSDGILSRGEKPGVIIDYNTACLDFELLLAKAKACAVPFDDFYASFDTLATYLKSISPPYGDVSTDTPIDATTWEEVWRGWGVAYTNMLVRVAGAGPSMVDGIATANQNLTTNASAPVLDTITMTANKIVMLPAQTTKSQNGIYRVSYTPPAGSPYNVMASSTTTASYGGGSIVNPAYGYDVTGGVPDNTTYAVVSSGNSSKSSYGTVIYSGFSGTGLTGDMTIEITPFCDQGTEFGSGIVTVSLSTDGGQSYSTIATYEAYATMQTITVPLSGVNGSDIRVRVKTSAANDYDAFMNVIGILSSWANIHSVYIAIPSSGSANWSFVKQSDIPNASVWRTRAGSTYGIGPHYVAAVASDNGITLTAQDPPYEAPIGKPSSGTAFMKRSSTGATSWEARRYGFPDYSNGSTRTVGTVYQAAEDGWLSLVLTGGYINEINVYVGSTNNPTNQIWKSGDDLNQNTKHAGILLPIPSGTYYKVTNGTYAYETISYRWFPALA